MAAPTISDVAERAGVSRGAASMALRGNEKISAETREKVSAAAHEIGYVPNAAARSLREQRAGAIAVVVPQSGRHVFGHAYFMHLLKGINDAANQRDSVVIISTNPGEEHGVAAYERILRSGRSDGVIVASAALGDPYVANVADAGVPMVLVGDDRSRAGVSTVGIPDEESAFLATRHLVEVHGHERIAHISGPTDHQTGKDRLAGFARAMGDSFDDALVRLGGYDEASGSAAMASLLEAGPPFSGLFCANDEMAYSAMQVATSAGMAIPRDLAVVGFDDFGLARVVSPSLSTVRVPAEEMGRSAADLLFDLIDAGTSVHRLVETEFVPRQSCGCLV